MDANTLAKEHNFGFLQAVEVDALREIAASFKDKPGTKVFVNLGAGAGTSAMAMREGCPDAVIYTVDNDTWRLGMEKENFAKAGLPMPTQIHGCSWETGDLWTGPEVDFIFVDADHKEQSVLADIDAWKEHVKDGGVMAFHDYGHPNFPGVKTAVDTWFTAGYLYKRSYSIVAYRVIKDV